MENGLENGGLVGRRRGQRLMDWWISGLVFLSVAPWFILVYAFANRVSRSGAGLWTSLPLLCKERQEQKLPWERTLGVETWCMLRDVRIQIHVFMIGRMFKFDGWLRYKWL
jgi:hypothetical protein